MKATISIWLFIIVFSLGKLHADDFFEIHDIRYCDTQPNNGPAVYVQSQQVEANGQKIIKKSFCPSLEIRISAGGQIKTSSAFAHAYFYDQNRNLIATIESPSVVDWGNGSLFNWPLILPKDTTQSIFFALPDKVLQQDGWSAVVVFGDSKGVDAQLYPGGDELSDYDYPEKNILEDKSGPPIERATAMDPLIEHVVPSDNPKQPQITLFLRPPLGMTDASQAKGVLCMSLLAGNLDGVKRQLQGYEAGEQLKGMLKFAQDHKLIIICWGSHGLWDPRKSWDDLSPDAAWDTDEAFNQVTKAWVDGIQYFVKEYGIPSNGYLLWGVSGSAQYACRLALRRPEYFLAVHVHIPSSFDKPTPEANRVLWCLTTGEQESGYRRSLRFYKQCRTLGYPMIYKAIIGLGHAGSPVADNLGLKFFEFALSVRDQRQAYDDALNNPLTQFQMAQTAGDTPQPWLVSFQKPAYVGDIVNQVVFPQDQEAMVPAGFRVPLPTKDIADAWNK